MGISDFLTGMVCGAAAVGFILEGLKQHRLGKPQKYPTQVNTLNAKPTSAHEAMSVDELLEASIAPNAELTRIQKAICRKVGARPDSNEADYVMAAIFDGTDWDRIREMADRQMWMPSKFSPVNRIYGRI